MFLLKITEVRSLNPTKRGGYYSPPTALCRVKRPYLCRFYKPSVFLNLSLLGS